MTRRFTVVLEPDDREGGFVARVPALPGCVTQGEDVEEALANAREAIELVVEDITGRGGTILDDHVVVAEVEVTL